MCSKGVKEMLRWNSKKLDLTVSISCPLMRRKKEKRGEEGHTRVSFQWGEREWLSLSPGPSLLWTWKTVYTLWFILNCMHKWWGWKKRTRGKQEIYFAFQMYTLKYVSPSESVPLHCSCFAICSLFLRRISSISSPPSSSSFFFFFSFLRTRCTRPLFMTQHLPIVVSALQFTKIHWINIQWVNEWIQRERKTTRKGNERKCSSWYCEKKRRKLFHSLSLACSLQVTWRWWVQRDMKLAFNLVWDEKLNCITWKREKEGPLESPRVHRMTHSLSGCVSFFLSLSLSRCTFTCN